ncbi:helix-turn-helix domain-containing protein [Microbacterium sp. NPDC055683]
MDPTRPLPFLGITLGASRGLRSVYRFAGSQGIDRMSLGVRVWGDDAESFSARLISVPLEEIAFEDVTMSRGSIERTADHIAALPLDLVRLLYVLDGAMHFRSGDADFRVESGQMIAIAPTETFRIVFEGQARHQTLIAPARLLRLLPGRIDVVRREPLPPSASLGLLAAIMRSLPQHSPRDNTEESELLAHSLIDLMQAVVRTRGRGIASSSPEDDIRRRVYDIIEREYNDPDLRASTIAPRLTVSVRNLHRLFADEPRSIAHAIRLRRVEAMGRDLLITQDAFEIIAHQAGFGSDDSAYRAFREEKGMTPAEYRRRGFRSRDSSSPWT